MRKMDYGGMVYPSTVDWPGRHSVVLFFAGCSWNCPRCSNKDIRNGGELLPVSEVCRELGKIYDNDPMVSLVLSGGECTEQPEALNFVMGYSWGKGIPIAVETNGSNPDVLEGILDSGMVDHVFMDVKTSISTDDYTLAIGGIRGSWGKEEISDLGISTRFHIDALSSVIASLDILLASGIPFTIRTTKWDDFPTDDMMESLREFLGEHDIGVENKKWVIQQGEIFD